MPKHVRPTIQQLLGREVEPFDKLQAAVIDGIRDARHYDELEEQARGIARRMIEAFRKGSVH